MTDEFPAPRASNAENVPLMLSSWWPLKSPITKTVGSTSLLDIDSKLWLRIVVKSTSIRLYLYLSWYYSHKYNNKNIAKLTAEHTISYNHFDIHTWSIHIPISSGWVLCRSSPGNISIEMDGDYIQYICRNGICTVLKFWMASHYITHQSQEKITTIFDRPFWNRFPVRNNEVFSFKFHWN